MFVFLLPNKLDCDHDGRGRSMQCTESPLRRDSLRTLTLRLVYPFHLSHIDRTIVPLHFQERMFHSLFSYVCCWTNYLLLCRARDDSERITGASSCFFWMDTVETISSSSKSMIIRPLHTRRGKNSTVTFYRTSYFGCTKCSVIKECL